MISSFFVPIKHSHEALPCFGPCGNIRPRLSEALRWVIIYLNLFLQKVNLKKLCRYQVFEVNPKNKVSLEVLTKLRNERSDVYDFWTDPRNINLPVDIMVPPAFASTFINLMRTFEVDYKVKIADVEA